MNTSPDELDRVIALIDGALDDIILSPDAMRWRPTPPPPKQPVDIRPGDIVDYHGSIHSEHDTFIVVAVEAGGRLTIRNHWYPDTRLDNVRPTSVTPTGEWAPVCRCGHPHVHPITGPTGHCPRLGCDCPHHPA